ncbi:chromatin structure-remodeling complex protein syd [Anaeramoeba flamelloides]|uniref:Chromatin structure-remodeling complex protein syd n=1 Tax=Anaeramoeba flamelloides TaxID=1746091 RepID=A0AAV7Z7C9_9EUKA|nr:chromatin structure-remodeling complex protein syd [Anaeramoeba flamelloides]
MGTTLPKLEKPQNFSYQFLFNQKEPHQQESLSLIQKLHQTKTKKFKKEESEKEEDSEKKEEKEGLNDKKKGDHKKPETKDFEEKEIIIESLDSEQFEKSSSDEKEYDQDIEDIVIDENVIDDQYERISNEEEGEEEEKKEEEEEEKDNKIEEIISNEIAISEQSGRFPEEEEEEEEDDDDEEAEEEGDDDEEEEAEEEEENEKEKQEEEEKDNKIEEIISNEIAISEQSGRFPEEEEEDDDDDDDEEEEEEAEEEKQEEEEEKDNKIEEILSDEIAISEQSGRFPEEEEEDDDGDDDESEEEKEEEESNENLDSGSESLNISDTPSENGSESKSEEDENNIEPEPMWSPEEESESSGDEEDLTNEWIINRRLLNKIQNMQDHEIQQLYQRSIHKKNNEESKLLFTLKPDAYRKKNEISTEKIIPRFFIGTLKNMIFNLDEKFVKMEYQLLSDAIQNILLNVTKKVQNYSDKLINKLKIYLFCDETFGNEFLNLVLVNKYHKIYPDKQMEWESDKLTTIMKNKSKWITNEIIDQLKGFFKKTMHFFLDVLINSEVIAFAYLGKDSTFDEESCINIEEDLEEYEDEDELPQFVQLFPIIYRDEKIIKRGIVVFIEQYNEEIILGERKD